MVRPVAGLIALFATLAFDADAGPFVRSATANADTYLDEGDPTAVKASAITVLWSTANGTDRVPIMTFTVPSLLAGETLDSAHVVVAAVGSALDADTCNVYPLLRNLTYIEATWNQYATGSSWQVAGARGALDYDQDSLLYSFVNPTVNPESIFVARGTAFATYISNHLGESITLIWHDDGDDSNGSWTAASLEDGVSAAPALRLFGSRSGAARRISAIRDQP